MKKTTRSNSIVLKKQFLISIVITLFFSNFNYAQYVETFSISNKGILQGPCGQSAESCASSDFTGVNWTINGDLSGIDSGDNFSTNNMGVFDAFGDVDGEACIESPVVDISSAGTVNISVDLNWTSHDVSDYVNVDYQINNGNWVQVPNQFGGGSRTLDFNTDGNTGSGTVVFNGITGNTVSLRVCVNTNSSGDNTTIDNLSISGGQVLSIQNDDFGRQIKLYPNPTKDVIILSNGSNKKIESFIIYDIKGLKVANFNVNDDTEEEIFNIANISSGLYILEIKSKNASIRKRFVKK